jgi:hypothetical protein
MVRLKELCDEYGDPQKYESPDSYLATVQILALVRKYPFPSSAEKREAAAFLKFMEAEQRCREVNINFRKRRIPYKALNLLNRASFTIEKIFGDFSRQYETILRSARHGPGSSLCTTEDNVTLFYKSHDIPWSVGGPASKYVKDILQHDPHLGQLLGYNLVQSAVGWAPGKFGAAYLRECNFNSLTTVPKTAWIDRFIAVEPRFNLYLQLGTNAVLTRNLRSVGVYTNNQEYNREAAFWASLSGSGVATVDLSSASDCIAFELVRYLLRGLPEWYDFLYDLRSPFFKYNGEVRKYEKWSSMGNGYTFPLESAIFYSIVEACVNETCPDKLGLVRVYGDDIIIPTEAFTLLKELLATIGFVTNEQKTFTSGPFRESCGKDYWYGIDVRPFYLDFHPETAEDIFHILNSLCSVGHVLSTDAAYSWLLGLLHDGAILYGPEVEETRGHIWAPVCYLYANGHLKMRKRYQAMYYMSRGVVANSFNDSHLKELGNDRYELARYYAWLVSNDGSSEVINRFAGTHVVVVEYHDDAKRGDFQITRRDSVRRVSNWRGFGQILDTHARFPTRFYMGPETGAN